MATVKTVKAAPAAKTTTAKPAAVKTTAQPAAAAKTITAKTVSAVKPAAAKTSAKGGNKLKVTYVKSIIGFEKRQVKVLEALGFRKLNTVKIFPDNASIRGSIFKVKHLLKVEEIKE